jgi:hypothetical protein
MLLNIIGILTWGGGVHSTNGWAQLEKDDNLDEAIRTSIVAYVKPLKVAWGVWNQTLKSNKCNGTKKKGCNIKVSRFKNYLWMVCLHISTIFLIKIICIF